MIHDCLGPLIETNRRTKIRDGRNARFNGQTAEIYRRMYRRGGNVKRGRKTK